ncbi:hypothetical protein C8C83_2059 [Flavobacterium sp. 90]|uniref:hypothetical protein n=1 Tax=unclassified Flavobacterium TaxID=196869 RepID=UPI000EB1E20D|nr:MULTISPECIES: hypothetical protein [unclassified Flavobacterium]RKR10384.1 hypothetical protein C8C82_2362 [Flavobacterium sp. 81]TCK54169.1 hypothetical protein C8C83_2059 [Flavobacterium sp. 90]
MKETVYKSLLFSLLITNIWTVIIFFIYFFESPGWFQGLTTLMIFVYSCWFTSALGILSIIISFLKKWFSTQRKLFMLILIAWLNSFFSIILLIITSLEIVRSEAIFGFYLFLNLIVSIVASLIIKRILKNPEA